jgi:hypothetical protein
MTPRSNELSRTDRTFLACRRKPWGGSLESGELPLHWVFVLPERET